MPRQPGRPGAQPTLGPARAHAAWPLRERRAAAARHRRSSPPLVTAVPPQLHEDCERIKLYHTELKQQGWYDEILTEASTTTKVTPSLRRGTVVDLATSRKVLYFIELLCEGHNEEMQDHLRHQEGSRAQV